MNEKGQAILEGDNPDPLATTDSHAFGPVSIHLILGRIVTLDGE